MERSSFSVQPSQVEASGTRVGVRQKLTSVPLFLLASSEVDTVELHRVEYGALIQDRVRRSLHPEERSGWASVEAFFHAGGKLAWICLTPWKKQNSLAKALLGTGKGLRQGTGIRGIDRLNGQVDFLCLPQLPLLDDQKTWTTLVVATERAVRGLVNTHFLFEFPFGIPPEEVSPYIPQMTSDFIAAFYPHFFFTEDYTQISAVAVALAHFQKTAREFGMTESFANRNVNLGSLQPSRSLTPQEGVRLAERKVQTFRLDQNDQIRIWGDFTFGPAAGLSSHHAELHLRNAIEEVCDSFVFGPVTAPICEEVELRLEKMIQENRSLFDSSPDQAFGAKCSPSEQKGEPTLHVECWFRLPHTVDRIAMEFNVAS